MRNAAAATAGTCPFPMALYRSSREPTPSSTLGPGGSDVGADLVRTATSERICLVSLDPPHLSPFLSSASATVGFSLHPSGFSNQMLGYNSCTLRVCTLKGLKNSQRTSEQARNQYRSRG